MNRNFIVVLFVLFCILPVSTRVEAGDSAVGLDTAMKFLGRQDFKAALNAFAFARDAGEDPAKTTKYIAYCLAKLGRNRAALPEYEAALDLDPDDPWLKIGLASARIKVGKGQEAVPLLRELAGRSDEWGVRSRRMLALYLAEADLFAEAATALEAVLADAPQDLKINWMYGVCLRNSGKTGEALAQFRKIARSVPNPDKANLYSAMCLEQLGETPDAEKIYEALVEADSEMSSRAAASLERLTGDWFNMVLSLTAGYDNGLLASDDRENFIDDDSSYIGSYTDLSVRLLRSPSWRLWAGGRYQGSNYPSVDGNDYVGTVGYGSLNWISPGPLSRLSLDCEYGEATIDGEDYSDHVRISLSGAYRSISSYISAGVNLTGTDYSGDNALTSGSEYGCYAQWRYYLPGPSHSLRARASWTRRRSDDDYFDRDRVSTLLAYRTRLFWIINGELRGTYRRDDYYNSYELMGPPGEEGMEKRVDDQLGGALRLDAWITDYAKVNLGFLYQSRHSREEELEYDRRVLDVGLTLYL